MANERQAQALRTQLAARKRLKALNAWVDPKAPRPIVLDPSVKPPAGLDGGSIIGFIAEKYGMTVADLTGPARTNQLISIRQEAMLVLKERGFNVSKIARLINRERTTVLYFVSPERREYKKEFMRRYRRSDEARA